MSSKVVICMNLALPCRAGHRAADRRLPRCRGTVTRGADSRNFVAREGSSRHWPALHAVRHVRPDTLGRQDRLLAYCPRIALPSLRRRDLALEALENRAVLSVSYMDFKRRARCWRAKWSLVPSMWSDL